MRWTLKRGSAETADNQKLLSASRPVLVLTWPEATTLSQTFHQEGRSLRELFEHLDEQRADSGRPGLAAHEVRIVVQAWAESLQTSLNARTCRDVFTDMPPVEHARRHLSREWHGTTQQQVRRAFVVFDVVLVATPVGNVGLVADRLRMSALARLIRRRLQPLEVLTWASPTRVIAVAADTAALPLLAVEIAERFTRELGQVADPVCCGVNAQVVGVPEAAEAALELLDSLVLAGQDDR